MIRDDLDLAGLRALVTSGTKGIGEAVVVRLREAGAKVLMPCKVIAADADAIELSLAENVIRAPLPPVDSLKLSWPL